MTSIFEGRKLCLFQPKQGSFGFQAYILCIYIYIYIPNLAVRWFKETTKRSWPDDLKKEKVHENLHRLPWVHDPSEKGLDQIPNPNNALLREILSKLLYICIWGFPKMVAPNNHGFSY